MLYSFPCARTQNVGPIGSSIVSVRHSVFVPIATQSYMSGDFVKIEFCKIESCLD